MRYVSTITKTSYLNWGFLFFAILISSQCIAPFSNPISRYIAEHTVHIMLVFFLLGGIALISKHPIVLLYSWIACAGLCHFLKDVTTSPFYYASADLSENSLQISHFELESSLEQEQLLQLNQFDLGDIVSVQSSSNPDFSKQLFKKLRTTFPYTHQLHYLLDVPQSIYVFSKIPINITDTFYFDRVPYITGFVKIDSQHRKIQFISLNIPDEEKSSTINGLKKVAEHWAYKSQHSNHPIIAFGDIQTKAWLPEVRAFRTRLTLNDSRLDLNLSADEKHIFYSNHLRCTEFQTLGNGTGVRGTYQFKSQNVTLYQKKKGSKDDILSQR